MLLSFSIENYKGFRNRQEFNMISTSGNEFSDHLFALPNETRVNSLACIVGPNGAGKTHLFNGLHTLTRLIGDRDASDRYEPFLLDEDSMERPTSFEVLLFNNENQKIYRYGLEIFKDEIINEWLYTKDFKKSSKEKVIFTRDLNSLQFNRTLKSIEKLMSDTTNKATVISFSELFHNDDLAFVFTWAHSILPFEPDSHNMQGMRFIEDLLKVDEKINLQEFLEETSYLAENLGIPISDIQYETIEDEKKFVFYHKTDDPSVTIKVPSDAAEHFFSRGTVNILAFLLFYRYTMLNGSSLLVDEFDGTIHHRLACVMVDLFHKLPRSANTFSGQVFFTTHNINLLDRNLRRDEIHIITKDKNLSSQITRVSDFSIRKDVKVSAKYLNNEFGGLPQCIEEAFNEYSIR